MGRAESVTSVRLTLTRRWPTSHATVGSLALDETFQCWTLEPPLTPLVSDSPVAIPEGTYPVTFAWSPKLRAVVPHLVDVPGRTHILIHIGNFPRDTEGCVLVGQERGPDAVYDSHRAFEALCSRLTIDAFPVTMQVTHALA